VKPEGTGDLQSQIELKKLDFEQSLRLEEIKEERIKRDREWEMEKQKLQDEREDREAERERERKRDELLPNALPRIGAALAQGIIDQDQRSQEQPVQRKGRRPQPRIEAGYGQSGEVPCPHCETPVGVGATARTAECVQCGERFTITRVEENPPAAEQE